MVTTTACADEPVSHARSNHIMAISRYSRATIALGVVNVKVPTPLRLGASAYLTHFDHASHGGITVDASKASTGFCHVVAFRRCIIIVVIIGSTQLLAHSMSLLSQHAQWTVRVDWSIERNALETGEWNETIRYYYVDSLGLAVCLPAVPDMESNLWYR